MRRYSLWVLLVIAIIAIVAFALSRRFPLVKLTPFELKVSMPRVPIQESAATIECTGGLAVNLENVNGEWSIIQDHPQPSTLCR